MNDTTPETPAIRPSLAAELSEQAAWLEEGADEHEAGNGAVDLAGRARTVATALHNIGTDYRDQLREALAEADEALGGDSSDAEHDALYSVRETIAGILGVTYDAPSPDDGRDDEDDEGDYDTGSLTRISRRSRPSGMRRSAYSTAHRTPMTPATCT